MSVEQFYNDIPPFKSHILSCMQFQIECWSELLEMQVHKASKLYNGNEKNDDYEAIKEGHLVMMKCGHVGKPSRMEEKRISRLLRKSGFIPMLEEIYKKQGKDSKKVSKNLDKDKDQSTNENSKIIMITEREKSPMSQRTEMLREPRNKKTGSYSKGNNRKASQSPMSAKRIPANNTALSGEMFSQASEDEKGSIASKASKAHTAVHSLSPNRSGSQECSFRCKHCMNYL